MIILTIAYIMNGLLMISFPIGLAVFLIRRWRIGWRIWWIGFTAFIISQIGHIPFNLLVDRLVDRSRFLFLPLNLQLGLTAVFLGVSAGVFEEVTRYLVLRFWAKDARSWRNGFLFGAGHGGAEAIILGVLALITSINMILIRDMDLTALVPAGQLDIARQQIAAFWSATWYSALLGAVERVLAICAHIFMATLVMRSILRRRVVWLLAAIGFHALLDSTAVLSLHYLGPYWTEGLVALYAVVSVVFLLSMNRDHQLGEGDGQAPGISDKTHSPSRLPELAETSDNLDQTQWQD